MDFSSWLAERIGIEIANEAISTLVADCHRALASDGQFELAECGIIKLKRAPRFRLNFVAAEVLKNQEKKP